MNSVEFLTELYRDVGEGWLETTFICPEGLKIRPKVEVLWRRMPIAGVDKALPILKQHNQQGYGVHFGLAVRRERKFPEERINTQTGEKWTMQYPRGWAKDALYLTAFYADADSKDYPGGLDEARERAARLKPSITVESGGGIHSYLCLDQPLRIGDDNRNDVKRVLRGLAKAAGSDSSVAELARVFRLPGTINTKPNRNRAACQVVDFNGARYTYSQLFTQYAPFDPPPERKPRADLNVSTDELRRALSCIPAETIPYVDWLKVIAGLTHTLGAAAAKELGEWWSGGCSQTGEIESKVDSLEGSGDRQATLGTVFWLAKSFGYNPPDRETRNRSLRQRAAEVVMVTQPDVPF